MQVSGLWRCGEILPYPCTSTFSWKALSPTKQTPSLTTKTLSGEQSSTAFTTSSEVFRLGSGCTGPSKMAEERS